MTSWKETYLPLFTDGRKMEVKKITLKVNMLSILEINRVNESFIKFKLRWWHLILINIL
jgi:hypothetical protein